jgi:hypothetical protein
LFNSSSKFVLVVCSFWNVSRSNIEDRDSPPPLTHRRPPLADFPNSANISSTQNNAFESSKMFPIVNAFRFPFSTTKFSPKIIRNIFFPFSIVATCRCLFFLVKRRKPKNKYRFSFGEN